MKIFFLMNPSKMKNRWDFRDIAAKTAKTHGWLARFGDIDRSHPASMERTLSQALEEGCSRIVCVGGDGTLHRAINLLAKQNVLTTTEIAVIPAGTCNDFARLLGFNRRYWTEALRVACAGKAKAMDLGQMDDDLFLNNAGFGRRPIPKAKRLKPLQALRGFKPIPLRATWDKGSIEGTFYMGLACNAPFYSGGLHFSKNMSLTDNLLDIYLIPAMPKWKLFSLLALGRLGRPTRFRRLITLRLTRIEIESQTDLWPQADGEPPAKATRRVVFAVAPEKAMIVAP